MSAKEEDRNIAGIGQIKTHIKDLTILSIHILCEQSRQSLLSWRRTIFNSKMRNSNYSKHWISSATNFNFSCDKALRSGMSVYDRQNT